MHAEPLGRSSGAVLGKMRKEKDSREDNRWRARCLLLPQHGHMLIVTDNEPSSELGSKLVESLLLSKQILKEHRFGML